ncbi:MAG: hypothetical protein ABI560_04340 [Myxococcales bacterium]
MYLSPFPLAHPVPEEKITTGSAATTDAKDASRARQQRFRSETIALDDTL